MTHPTSTDTERTQRPRGPGVPRTVALVGARGHVGAELLTLLAEHPELSVVLAASREHAGVHVGDVLPHVDLDLSFESLDHHELAKYAARVVAIDAWLLALPNGLARPWVKAIHAIHPGAVIVDLSTDHRFDREWVYGLPEIHRSRLLRARKIANPGCYATGAQLGLFPVLAHLEGAAHIFGVSGYSGAGTTPSPRNDPQVLADNLLPYALTGHSHEQEIRWQLGHKAFFTPHVAPFFRGITLTISFLLRRPLSSDELAQRYLDAYQHEPLIRVTRDIPLVRDAADRHEVHIGGFAVEPETAHAVIVVTLDNLLKGAATQDIQNLNLALGMDELAGLRHHLA